MNTLHSTCHIGMKGFFKIEAIRPDGSRRMLADWFPNLITNNGLNLFTTDTGYINYCQVGAGNATPANSNTSLSSYIAGTSNPTITRNISGTSPYYSYIRNVYRFNAGVAAGNLSEVGVGASNSGNLFSRALIVDGSNVPTTITVLGDEVLDVTYEFRMYPKITDTAAAVTLDAISYTCTVRPGNLTSEGDWRLAIPGNANNFNPSGTPINAYPAASTLGSVTSTPSGSAISGQGTVSAAAYVTNSYYRDLTLSFSLNAGNGTGGMGAVLFQAYPGDWQIGFSPAIPKDNTKILTLVVRFSWARQP